MDGLKEAILDAAKERLDQAVADGKLTRAQADELYSRLESHVDDIVNRTPRSGPFGGPRPMMAPLPAPGAGDFSIPVEPAFAPLP